MTSITYDQKIRLEDAIYEALIEEGILDDIKQAYKDLKVVGSDLLKGDLKLVSRATKLAWNDFTELAERDPVAFGLALSEILSVFDPTGIADLVNAVVYYSREEYLAAFISAMIGSLTATAAILTVSGAGTLVGVGFYGLVKSFKAIKAAGNVTKLIPLFKALLSVAKPVLNFLKKAALKIPGLKKIVDWVAGVFQRMQAALTQYYKTVEEALEDVFQSTKTAASAPKMSKGMAAKAVARAKKAGAVAAEITKRGLKGKASRLGTDVGTRIKVGPPGLGLGLDVGTGMRVGTSALAPSALALTTAEKEMVWAGYCRVKDNIEVNLCKDYGMNVSNSTIYNRKTKKRDEGLTDLFRKLLADEDGVRELMDIATAIPREEWGTSISPKGRVER